MWWNSKKKKPPYSFTQDEKRERMIEHSTVDVPISTKIKSCVPFSGLIFVWVACRLAL